MQKNKLLIICFLIILGITGCSDKGDVKVYDNTENPDANHVEKNFPGIVKEVDIEGNLITFLDCLTGEELKLTYHSGVSITSKEKDLIALDLVLPGDIFDVVYYEDTNKLVSMKVSSKYNTKKGISKLTINSEKLTARYQVNTCKIAETAFAYDDKKLLDIGEISTEDEVTLCFYGDVLFAVRVDKGHGYVRLINQDTYVGGMVEIGYDVIVPVTDDMLIPVREGEYTLRIEKNGYKNTKPVTVNKGKEVEVDIADIAIPSGTAVFKVLPEEADVFVNDNKIDGYTFTGVYGEYSLKIEAEGYKSFNGSFKLNDSTKTIDIELSKIEEETTELTTEETVQTTPQGTMPQTTPQGTGETTQTSTTTANTITIKGPAAVDVYIDGDYVGVTPVSFPKTVGTHTVTIYKPGYLIKSYTIESIDDGVNQEFTYPELTAITSVQ